MRKIFRLPETLILLVSFWVMLTCNLSFWRIVASSDAAGELPLPVYFLSLGVLVTGLVFLVLLLLAHSRLTRPVLAVALVTAAATSYFMNSYGIVVDMDMLVNVVETNPAEAFELFSPGLILTVGLLGLLPAIVVWRYPIAQRGLVSASVQRVAALLLALAMIVTPLLVVQKEVYSLARNHREVGHMITPLNVFVASWKYADRKLSTPPDFRTVGVDATHDGALGPNIKPKVHVLIVGETARAANFSLGRYDRETNPQLGRREGVHFLEALSCGTATATSLPCMFSLDGHDQFDATTSKYSDNLLDIAKRSGYKVVWLDNGNSCKGVCARVESHEVHALDTLDVCADGECFDEILVVELEKMLPTIAGDTLFVLHQLGSHGPAYYRRYPDAFRTFTPDCRSPNLGDCTDEQIVNAYDNTIVYTDHVIASAIDVLARNADRIDGSLIYVSDHGESLGENNLYLHGMPYGMAPDYQTHVPWIAWTPAARQRPSIDLDGCASGARVSPVSHDYLFHTELGVLGIETEVYDPTLDVGMGCNDTSFASEGVGSGRLHLPLNRQMSEEPVFQTLHK